LKDPVLLLAILVGTGRGHVKYPEWNGIKHTANLVRF